MKLSGLFAALSAVLGASLIFPAQWLEKNIPILCLSRRLGFACPACGLTRGFCSMGHGGLLQAFHYNPLSPALYVGAWLFWAFLLFEWLRRRKSF